MAAVAIAGRPMAAITAIATSANARCQMVLWAEDDLKVWVLIGLKIVRTAPNRYVSGPERARSGNGKLTITKQRLAGLGGLGSRCRQESARYALGLAPQSSRYASFRGDA